MRINVAIVSVLWSIALLSIVSVSLLWSGNVSYRLAHNTLEAVTTDAIAEAAVNRAVLGLLDSRPLWRTDGSFRQIELDGVAVTVSVQDELGRIDLNVAEAGLLSGLLRSSGLDAQAASALTDKILDWREADTGRRLNGANEADYRAAGLSYRPRNGPFQSVEEVQLVMDMTPDLFRRIAPALTVYSGRPNFDPQLAPREALLALPNMDSGKVTALLASRSNQQSIIERSLSLRGRAFAIQAEFTTGNVRHLHQSTIRLTDGPDRPYWILAWKTK